MAILTELDKDLYFPTLPINGFALDGAIALIQSILESPMGANRPLEATEFNEFKQVHRNRQTVQLSYLPLVPGEDITLQARVGGDSTAYGRPIGIGDWETIPSEDYTLQNNGRLYLQKLSTSYYFGRTNREYAEVQVTYTSGFDFTADTPEIRTLKAIAGQALTFYFSYQMVRVGDTQLTGVKVIDVDQEYRVEFAQTAASEYSGYRGPGSLPDTYLIPFRKYRPRHWR